VIPYKIISVDLFFKLTIDYVLRLEPCQETTLKIETSGKFDGFNIAMVTLKNSGKIFIFLDEKNIRVFN